MPKKNVATVQVIGLTEMRSYFDHEVDAEIETAKRGFSAVVSAFAERVRSQVPVGDPKRRRGTGFYEGKLADSVEEFHNSTTDEVEGIVSVGAGTDYWQFAQADLAREGRSWFNGQDEAEALIDRVLEGEEFD